jgi:PST family polysaccharide transporter
MMTTVLAKTLSFVAQIVLGWQLSKGDFGVYAIAMSAASFAFALRDGGLWQVLIARGSREYETLAGPIFWLGIWASVTIGVLLVAAAPVIALLYHDPRLTWLIIVIAVSWPLSSPCWVPRARLVVELRFKELGACQMIASVLRYGSMITFAACGFGPMSFVLPLLVAAVSDNVTALWFTRERAWLRSANVRSWGPLLAEGTWCVVGTIANSSLEMGVYLVMGAVATKDEIGKAEVGLYYFAYQLVAQTGALLAANVQGVLLPTLSRIDEDVPRRRRAAIRSLSALMAVSAPASIGLAVVFPPLERIVWHGKWSDALWPVLVLGVAYPFRAIFALPVMLEMSQRHFKRAALMTLATGAALMLAGGVAAAVRPSAACVAPATGTVLVIASLFWTARTFARMHVPLRAILATTGLAWVVALLCGAAAFGADFLLAEKGVNDIARAVCVGALFAGSFAVVARLFLSHTLRDLVSTGPAGLRAPLSRALLLTRA